MSEKIAFIADSCADLPKEIQEKENVFVLPVIVSVEGKEYLDGVEISAETVYHQQSQGGLPTTSLPTGAMVEKVFTSVLEKGYEKAVLFTMSSAISGTWNLCRLLCEDCKQLECLVFDSKMASLAEGALLVELMEEVEAGAVDWEGIPARLMELQKNTFPYFGIDTLEFLQKNGRIGKATAFAGNLLNVMPILSFDENGVITPVEKVRGRKK
ncbi:DegV, partial [gut metagenome]